MIDFDPTLAKQDTDTLIAIANSYRDRWYPDAIEQAKTELQKRKITIEYQKERLREWDNEIEQREIEYNNALKDNVDKRYSKFEMIKIFILAPSILIGRDAFDTGLSLIGLWRENYKAKFRLRIILLIAGTIFWISFIICVIKFYDFQ